MCFLAPKWAQQQGYSAFRWSANKCLCLHYKSSWDNRSESCCIEQLEMEESEKLPKHSQISPREVTTALFCKVYSRLVWLLWHNMLSLPVPSPATTATTHTLLQCSPGPLVSSFPVARFLLHFFIRTLSTHHFSIFIFLRFSANISRNVMKIKKSNTL